MTNAPWRITLADVSITERERRAVDDVLTSGWLSMGPRTEEFEERLSEYIGSGVKALAVANGTAALHLAAAGLGLGPDDEVIVPALTFVASASGIRHTGATVRLADSLSLDDFSLDPAEIERLVTPRTKAVVVVHYGGYPVDVTAITELAERHGLYVIEDAAHALGSEIDGRRCGALWDASCFSFFPNKNMTTGEGGAVAFRDDAAAARARQLRSHGMTTLTWDRHRGHASSYDVVEVGFNYRIDEIRAALGIVQLSRLNELNAIRRGLTERYRERLASVEAGVFPTLGGRGTSACHLIPFVADSGELRTDLVAKLTEARIQTSVHYPAMHRFSAYQREDPPSLPVAEAIADRVMTLPLHPNLSEDDVDEICSLIDGVRSTVS
jgi:dTDP-4-amino-4,6-dideoxygalactose transaminase